MCSDRREPLCIDSISLAPDTIVKTTIDLKKTEESLGR